MSFVNMAGDAAALAGNQYLFEVGKSVGHLISLMKRDMRYDTIVFYNESQRVPDSHEITRYRDSHTLTVVLANEE